MLQITSKSYFGFFPDTQPTEDLSQENFVGHTLTCLAVQSLSELVNRRRHLQALVQNGPLALESDVAGPFHKACEITLRLDILS